MRTVLLLALVVLAHALVARAEDKPPPVAWSVHALPSSVKLKSVETMESAPPQFALNLMVDMPEPQWKLKLLKADKPDAEGRIRVRIKGTRPKGVGLPQVITATPLRVPLGALRAGRYVVDVILDMDDIGVRPVGAILLSARAK